VVLRSWQDVFTQEEKTLAANTEILNFIEAQDVGSMLDGYGWIFDFAHPTQFDPDYAFDPIAHCVFDGLDEYCRRVHHQKVEQVRINLDHLLVPLDVIFDSLGFATRFKFGKGDEDELELASDALDFLANFFFLNLGMDISITVQTIDFTISDDGSEQTLAVFRWNRDMPRKRSHSARIENTIVSQISRYVKVHGLTNLGTLKQLKWAGGMICPGCREPGLIRVPADAAASLSRLGFNPSDQEGLRVYAALNNSERETLITGFHEYCWPSGK
jgi:hypothetical protein